MKRKVVAIALSYIAGLSIAGFCIFSENLNTMEQLLKTITIALFIVLILMVVFARLYYNCKPPKLYFALPFIVIFGAYMAISEVMPDSIFDRIPCEARGTVQDILYEKDGYYILSVKVNEIISDGLKDTKKHKIIAKLNSDEAILIYDNIHISGNLEQLDFQRNPNSFDSYFYYKSDGYDYAFKGDVLSATAGEKTATSYVFAIKEKCMQIVNDIFNEEHAAIIKAALLGEKGDINEEMEELHRKNGVSHLLVVSGLHISLLTLMIYKALMLLHINRKTASLISMIFLTLYLILTGFSPSSTRAFLMGMVLLLANIVERQNDFLTSLFLSAFIIVLVKPLYLFRISFLFSYITVFVLVYAPPIIENIKFPYLSNETSKEVWKLFAVPFSAFIATVPLCAYYFYEISIIGILANVILVPFFSVVLGVAFFVVLTGFISMHISVFMAGIVYYVLKMYEIIMETFARLPISMVHTGKISISMIIIFYFLFFCFCHAVHIKLDKIWTKIAVCVILIVSVASVIVTKPRGMEIMFFDVKQGDSCFISANDINMLVDTGGQFFVTESGNTAKKVIVPYLKSKGIKELDMVFLSHFDNDHAGAVLELMDLIPVKSFYISAKADHENALYKEFAVKASKMNIPISFLSEGDRLNIEDFSIDVLHPNYNMDYDNENASSLVLKFMYKDFSMLFTGDITKEEEISLIGKDIKSTVVKISHHGAKTSSDYEFLQYISPKMALMGVGRDNSYNHPSEETLNTLNSLKIPYITTADNGAVIIKYDKEITLYTMREVSCYEKFKRGH